MASSSVGDASNFKPLVDNLLRLLALFCRSTFEGESWWRSSTTTLASRPSCAASRPNAHPMNNPSRSPLWRAPTRPCGRSRWRYGRDGYCRVGPRRTANPSMPRRAEPERRGAEATRRHFRFFWMECLECDVRHRRESGNSVSCDGSWGSEANSL